VAPEQVAGAKQDARADIYSLGCVLWEALTGQVPYPRESAVAKMYAHASEPPPAPSPKSGAGRGYAMYATSGAIDRI
jgi:serine/threonine-protein kinase